MTPNINKIIKKVKRFARRQQIIDFSAHLIFTISTILISLSIALWLFKSPLYGVIGLVPLLFYRPRSLIHRTRTIEKKIGLHGELVNSIQLACIPEDNKERYSQELINAYIEDAAIKIRDVDFTKYVSYKSIRNTARFLLVSIAFALLHPAILPEHFWYSLNHTVYYSVLPENAAYPQGSEITVALLLNGVYVPSDAQLIISTGEKVTHDKVAITQGAARKTIRLDESTTYQFKFLEYTTDTYALVPLEPLYIEALSFYFMYPRYTKLNDETKTGRQLIAPAGTKIQMQGRASQPLTSAQFILNDTLSLHHEGKEFSGEFTLNASGTATLFLKSFAELKEKLTIYSIPDMPPLVDIFYPGYNVDVPNDMQLEIGIRCSDDYGLDNGTFYYTFEEESTKHLALERGAIEDTIYFQWDLSGLGMLPGDEISYYAKIKDNAGNVSKSKTYYIYFPTMEEIYSEISEKEERIGEDFEEVQSEHTREIDEVTRIQQKIMKERNLLWAEQEKLREVISREKDIVDKIDSWKAEIERTIEKLNEGVFLDQESIERLQEISQILQEIAPEELKRALEELELALSKKPEDVERALENLKKNQQELAKVLERTLELLKRYQQEENLRKLAERAKELALKAEEMDKSMKEDENLTFDREMGELNEGMEELSKDLDDLAASEDLEEKIKELLEQLAQQTSSLSKLPNTSFGEKKQGMDRIATDLQKLYESLVQGRAASLRKGLLEIANQLIDISKTEERLSQKGEEVDIDHQDQVINATKVVAESLYTQQTKSLYVTPTMGKNIAKAIKHMEKVEQKQSSKQNAREAMRLLNVVCFEIFKNLEQAAQSQSSTGMGSFMQQLSNISKGQMSLNQLMPSFFPIPMDGLTAQQKAQLRRLAGRQRALREALESLRSSAGGTKYQELLDNLINEMEETEEALFQHKIDRELIERQKMILSRLLDAQKSIRKEDYEKKRKSEPGSDFIARETPESLPEDLGRDELRELIRKALQESYPEEYEFYIREYFKSLLEEK